MYSIVINGLKNAGSHRMVAIEENISIEHTMIEHYSACISSLTLQNGFRCKERSLHSARETSFDRYVKGIVIYH